MDIKRYNFAIVIAIFAVMMSGVMLTAIISFSNMVQINQRVGSDTISQQQLFLLGSLMVELQQAENSVRAYRLTREPGRLEGFYAHTEACSGHLAGLKNLSVDNGDKQVQLDGLSILVQQKLEILEDLSQLANRSSVVSELERISSRLGRQAAVNAVEPKPLGFIRNLFSSNRQSSSNLDSLQKHMFEEVEQTKLAQSNTLQRIDSEEFKYLEKTHAIDSAIESLIADLRFDSLNMVAEAVADKERQQIASNRKIRLFSVAAGLFLVLGGIAGWSYAMTRRKYEKALQQAKYHAEMYVGMQERFIANMSHEVRTPLHAIAGFTEQFMKSEDSQQKEAYRSLVNSAMKHLLQVVDDILDYSKLIAGKMKLKMEPFVPIEEVDAVAGIFSMEARTKGIRLATDIELVPQMAVVGDALRYRQVLMNLVSNAIKFTDKGNIRIRVYRQLKEDGRHMIATEVSDEGVGISEEHLKKLFKPFEQVGLAAEGTYRGTGLGLAISREIVEQQGGNILLESKPGIGTRVVFSLPYLQAVHSGINSSDTELPDGSFLKGMRILVADDEQWNSRLVASMLEKYGPELTIVEDGNQAYKELCSNPYDVALLDVRMPGKSGFEVAALAKKEAISKSVPIIALTAQAVDEYGKPKLPNQLNGFLIKPFSEDQLLVQLLKVFDKQSGSGHQQINGCVLPDNKPAGNGNMQGAMWTPGRYSLAIEKLAGGDAVFAHEMAALFVKNATKSLHEIRLAVNNKDHEAVEWHLHKLKPAVRQMQAGSMISLMHDLESGSKNGKPSEILNTKMSELEYELNNIFNELTIDFDLQTESFRIDRKL